MENLKKELDLYLQWCKEHTTRNLFEGISLSVNNYIKSHSYGLDETKAVEQNECCGSLDLEEMDKRLDLQLSKETKESLTEWLESKRNNTSP